MYLVLLSVFSIAYIMYLVLEMEAFFSSSNDDCDDIAVNVALVSIQLLFVILQTGFLFKVEHVRAHLPLFPQMWRNNQVTSRV